MKRDREREENIRSSGDFAGTADGLLVEGDLAWFLFAELLGLIRAEFDLFSRGLESAQSRGDRGNCIRPQGRLLPAARASPETAR